MKRLWIILLISLIWAAFSKIEGNNFIERNFFPFSNWTMIWPVYLWNICLNTVPAAFVWTLLSQETERPNEIKIAAWLVSFKLPWFLLTANSSFFRIKIFHMGVIPIGYDALMFILLGLVVLKATLYEQ